MPRGMQRDRERKSEVERDGEKEGKQKYETQHKKDFRYNIIIFYTFCWIHWKFHFSALRIDFGMSWNQSRSRAIDEIFVMDRERET